jgi:hypothetical protein
MWHVVSGKHSHWPPLQRRHHHGLTVRDLPSHTRQHFNNFNTAAKSSNATHNRTSEGARFEAPTEAPSGSIWDEITASYTGVVQW